MSTPPVVVDRRDSWFLPVAGTDVEFLAADFVDFRYPKHLHESLPVGIIERGAQRFATRSGTVVMPQREVCVVDAGLVHWGWADDATGWRYRMIYPSFATLALALERPVADVERLGFGIHTIDDAALFAGFDRLHRRAQAGDDVDAEVLRFLRALFARHADHRRALAPPTKRVAERIRAYLHDHPERTVESTELAAAADASVGHAIRSFSAAFGMSPAAYHLALRIDRARRLLAAGTPVAHTAAALGFYDQSHFHRHFARHVGCTPGAFVRAG